MEAASRAARDEAEREALLRKIMKRLSRMDFGEPPPVVARDIHRLIRSATGVDDPYGPEKTRFNAMALELLPSFEKTIASSPDPFAAALSLSVAGNVIDLGAKGTSRNAGLRFSGARNGGALEGDPGEFRASATAKKSSTSPTTPGRSYSTGPSWSALPPGRVTVAVRGGPVINDAVMAAMPGPLESPVSSPSSTTDRRPGTILRDCGASFRKTFQTADCIIAGAGELRDSLRRRRAPLVSFQGEVRHRRGTLRHGDRRPCGDIPAGGREVTAEGVISGVHLRLHG